MQVEKDQRSVVCLLHAVVHPPEKGFSMLSFFLHFSVSSRTIVVPFEAAFNNIILLPQVNPPLSNYVASIDRLPTSRE